MRMSELKRREVINVCDCKRLGFVGDLDVDPCTGRILAIIVPGPGCVWGFLGREKEYIIPFCDICQIGDDIILVRLKEEKKKEYNKISAYFNSDYGPGKFRGIFTQDNLQVYPIFTEWMQPFLDTGFTTVSNRSVGSTDHIPFDNAGIPAFQFIQDPMEWGRHSHRTQDFSDWTIYATMQLSSPGSLIMQQ
mgnify:CR=1 FL=1